jgi:hypothetical protein
MLKTWTLPALHCLIAHIIGLGTYPKMIDVYTKWIVALMQDVLIPSDISAINLPRNSVGSLLNNSKWPRCEYTVTAAQFENGATP